MKMMKKHIAITLTAALLAFPLSSAIVEACIPDAPVMVATSVPAPQAEVVDAAEAAETAVAAYEGAPITTLKQVATVEGLKEATDAAVDVVIDPGVQADLLARVVARSEAISTAKTELQVLAAEAVAKAEAAVLAYETAPITTLAEVETAEGLKAAAHDAVALVEDDAKVAFEARVTTRCEAINAQKATLEAQAALANAEAAVSAYDAAPLTTLAEVATAEGLKAAAVTAVEAVNNTEVKTALALKVTTKTAAIAAAKTALTPPVVVTDGKLVIPSTQYSDFIDKLQLALAFDPARKCELNKRHALRKLARAQQCMKEGNIEACKIAFSEYKDNIAKAQAFLLEAEDANSATAKTLAIALADVDAKNVQALSDLVVKLPPQAAQKLALNVVRTMDKAVVKIQKEDAKVDPAVTPVPVVTDADKKNLEKQAKAALTDFKTSVNDKDKTIANKKAKDNQCAIDQKNKLTVNQKFEKLGQQTFRKSDNDKDGRNHQGDRDNDKGGDNNRRDHK